MATATKPGTQTKTTVRPATTTTTSKTATVKKNAPQGNQTFLFDRDNYMWMIGGVVLILIGFALMAGGKSADPHQFNFDEIFSFRRITFAPMVMLIGFFIEVYAIMKKPKENPAV